MHSYVVYILECSNGCYYTGYTTDMARRYQEHLFGSGKCKYTRSFPPVKIAASWIVSSKDVSAPLKIERAIKQLSKQEKTFLIQTTANLSTINTRMRRAKPQYHTDIFPYRKYS